MTEWWMAERRNVRMAERRKGYIPNLPDIFTVHADDDDTDTDTDTNTF